MPTREGSAAALVAPAVVLGLVLSPRRGQARGDPGGADNTDSNTCRAREIERNYRRERFFSWRRLNREIALSRR